MKRQYRLPRSGSGRSLPLAGLRVLDFTRILSGPFCTMKLGDMGAEVIKVEQPAGGDDTRSWGPPFLRGESAYFLSVNRNKKSLTLNLKTREAKKIVAKLLRSSDILVENFRAGVMEKLGFGYDDVRKINPGIVYCSISGYGKTSSRSHMPSYDLIVQGESGLMDMTGFPDGPPTKTGISLADVYAGSLAFEGILLALLQKKVSGKGQLVDISLLDGLVSLFAYQSQIALSAGQHVTRKGNRHPTITPYEMFATRDGFINVAVGSEPAWRSFCSTVGRPGLMSDVRFDSNSRRIRNRTALEKILVPILRRKRSLDWIAAFSRADVPVGRINSLDAALKLRTMRERSMVGRVRHPKVKSLRMVGNPIKLGAMRSAPMSPPPLLSQHTSSILRGLGYSASTISTFSRKGII